MARDCMWASFHTSGSVEICIRGCVKYSFSKTQDTLNILTGNLLDNESDGESVTSRDEETCASECLAEDERDKLALKMTSELFQQTPSVQVFEHAPNRCINEVKDRMSIATIDGTAWIRISRGVARWALQSSEFAPDIQGTTFV